MKVFPAISIRITKGRYTVGNHALPTYMVAYARRARLVYSYETPVGPGPHAA